MPGQSWFLLLPILLGIVGGVGALPGQAQATESQGDSTALYVFLDCRRCDRQFIRNEVRFVNYVRDRADAQVHVLITDQRTASGGRAYRLSFLALRETPVPDQVLQYTRSPDDSDDTARRGLAKVLKIGLLPYVADRLPLENLTIAFAGGEAAAPVQQERDPWHNWIFEVDLGGWFESESAQRSYSVDGSFSADRVTEQWRVRTEVEYEYDLDRIDQGDISVRNTEREWEVSASVVRSLSQHWSIGVFNNERSDPSFNADLRVYLAPAVEYSVFPYAEVHRRELTLSYFLGVEATDYAEPTIFDETAETLLRQSLRLDLRTRQPWGSARVGAEAAHYFHDWSHHRLSLFGRIDVRLFRGLALGAFINWERVRDQLYLPKGDATLEEILLSQRSLATSYELSGSLGFSYTFGSIYNNIVNTRL